MIPRFAILAMLSLCAFFACNRVDVDSGRDAAIQVADAQFVREALPVETIGPNVRSVTVGTSFTAGAAGRSCSGEIEREGKAVAIMLGGDVGYWLVRAGIPSAAALDAPTFAAEVSFAKGLVGRRDLVVRAIDSAGRFGPPAIRSIDIAPPTLPRGELVVRLAWDNHADLDLHVVDPNGVEIFKRNINSYEPPPPGSPREPPGTPHDGGVLDFDSNAECIADGLSAENVVWSDPPPRGHYLVRVDTFSLCDEPVSRWRVQAFSRGVSIGTAEGISTEVDTRYSHNRGAGVLALEFDIP